MSSKLSASSALKVLSQQEWEKRPIFHGPVVSGRTLEGVAGYEIFLTLNAMSRDTLSCLQAMRVCVCVCVCVCVVQAIRVLNMPQPAVCVRERERVSECVCMIHDICIYMMYIYI